MPIIPSFFTGGGSNVFDPFSNKIWGPFQGLSSVINSLPNRLEGDAGGALVQGGLVGFEEEEVKVEVEEGRVLQISNERSRENKEKNDKWHRVERSSGKFFRRFRLPENAKLEEVKATMENGVLTVTVPKAEEKKQRGG